VAHITPISADGKTLTLEQTAATSTVGAQVFYDNLPAWNAAVASTTADGVTLRIPAGTFAVSDILSIYGRTGWTIEGAGEQSTELSSPMGVSSAMLSIGFSNNTTVKNFALHGNARLDGYGLGSFQNGYDAGIYFN